MRRRWVLLGFCELHLLVPIPFFFPVLVWVVTQLKTLSILYPGLYGCLSLLKDQPMWFWIGCAPTYSCFRSWSVYIPLDVTDPLLTAFIIEHADLQHAVLQHLENCRIPAYPTTALMLCIIKIQPPTLCNAFQRCYCDYINILPFPPHTHTLYSALGKKKLLNCNDLWFQKSCFDIADILDFTFADNQSSIIKVSKTSHLLWVASGLGPFASITQ